MQIHEILLLPPLAIACVGGSDKPLEADTDKSIHGSNRTVIRPHVTLKGLSAGTTRQAHEEYQRRQQKHGNDGESADPGLRARDLRSLTKAAFDDFVSVEHPSSFIDSAYARVSATLDQWGYPLQLIEIARRIAIEGTQHNSRLLAIKAALAPFDERRYLWSEMKPGVRKGSPDEDKYKRALDQLKVIIEQLTKAYDRAGHERLEESSLFVAAARTAMNELLRLGDELAAKNIGIDFFSLWQGGLGGGSRP
jgi:dsDNA-binding SOS-regulon protein